MRAVKTLCVFAYLLFKKRLLLMGVERRELLDLDSAENIENFVHSFYDKVLVDPVLAPYFFEAAKVDLKHHLPTIQSYWCKLLLGDKQYQNHTMNIHRNIERKIVFSDEAFDHWLMHFKNTAAHEFSGEKTDRAVVIASTIAKNMRDALVRERN